MTILSCETQDFDPMATASTDHIAAHEPRSFWVPVLCGAVILTIGIGARQSFGIFQKPIAAELGVGRELWSFANALSMLLMGLFSPFVGNVADRFGTARTVAAGGVLYVAGIFMIAAATEGVMLTARQYPVRDRHGGGRVRPDPRRDQPPDPGGAALDRARRRDGRRLVRPVRDRAVRLAAAAAVRQLARDDGDPRPRVGADGPAGARAARARAGRVRTRRPGRHGKARARRCARRSARRVSGC